MADEPWGLIGGGAGGLTAAAVLLGIWDRFFKRKDAKEEAESNDRKAAYANLDARGTAYMDRLEKSLTRVEAERDRALERCEKTQQAHDEVERQLDIERDNTRGWKTIAHDLKHDLCNAEVTINGLLPNLGRPTREWPDHTLPPIEAIVAFLPTYAALKESVRLKARSASQIRDEDG